MAAQRLGSILTNVTGTSNQILRVNTAETGFEFVAPASIPAYTITNETTDRVMDANDVTMDKVADILGTLIEDLAAAGLTGGGGVSAFTWSTSEQVWPFEKGPSGETLYCKESTALTLPNNGYANWTHNISGFNVAKVFKLDDIVWSTTNSTVWQMSDLAAANAGNHYKYAGLTTLSFRVYNQDMSAYSGKIRIIYWK